MTFRPNPITHREMIGDHESSVTRSLVRISEQLDYLIQLLEREDPVELDRADVLRSEVARCSSCGRFAWDVSKISTTCGLPQPDGGHCLGIFVANVPRRTTD